VLFHESDGGFEGECAEFELEGRAIGSGMIEGAQGDTERGQRKRFGGASEAELHRGEFGSGVREVGEKREDFCEGLLECFAAKSGKGRDFPESFVPLENESFSHWETIAIKTDCHQDTRKVALTI
jgi:hypothetical protein